MADETLDDSLKVAATNTGIDEGTIVSKKPRPQASHRQRFVIGICCCVIISMTHLLIFPFKCYILSICCFTHHFVRGDLQIFRLL